MGTEIERKFRVLGFDKALLVDGTEIEQGYLCSSPEVRVRAKGDWGFLTVKGEGSLIREEFEYRIPREDAKALLNMCSATVEKTRYRIDRFELDVFKGKLEGLILLEVELSKTDEEVPLPKGFEVFEVTGDVRFLNKNLAMLKSLEDIGLASA